MITLNWTQVSEMRQHAEHAGWLFVVDKVPNWDRHPQMRYDYHASAYRASTRHDVGTFIDSAKACDKCAEFINTKAGDTTCPRE